MTTRLRLARDAGALHEARSCLLFAPPLDLDMSLFGDARVEVVDVMYPSAAHWRAHGIAVTPELLSGRAYDLAAVFPVRAKAAARDQIARAATVSRRVLVDGQKTDGIEALMKEVKARVPLAGSLSKAHGKAFWFDGNAFDDWCAHPATLKDGWVVSPGVFSADAIDPGSALLAETLPPLTGQIADLGAGWGYLSARALGHASDLRAIHLVEANHTALSCARQNVTDPRAAFHWADALSWGAEGAFDTVLINPPFHQGRDADLELGRGFIRSAARLLRPGGTLWLVANRHLPYETSLQSTFASARAVAQNAQYKVFEARKRR